MIYPLLMFFCEELASFVADVDSLWVIIRSCGFVNICVVDILIVPQFVTVVKVRETICVEVYIGNSRLGNSSLTWIHGDECKLFCWSQLTSILSHFASVTADDRSVKSQGDIVKQHLQL